MPTASPDLCLSTVSSNRLLTMARQPRKRPPACYVLCGPRPLISHLSFPNAPLKPCKLPFALQSGLRNYHAPQTRTPTYNENQVALLLRVSQQREGVQERLVVLWRVRRRLRHDRRLGSTGTITQRFDAPTSASAGSSSSRRPYVRSWARTLRWPPPGRPGRPSPRRHLCRRRAPRRERRRAV